VTPFKWFLPLKRLVIISKGEDIIHPSKVFPGEEFELDELLLGGGVT
jgi:hypothetical protein